MNQRIRELAAQAGATVDKGTHPLTGVVDGLIMRTTEIEKFAELLVGECARIGELKEQDHEDYDSDISVGWYMKQHFGVE